MPTGHCASPSPLSEHYAPSTFGDRPFRIQVAAVLHHTDSPPTTTTTTTITTVAAANINLEKVAVLFNIAALQSQIAQAQSFASDDGLKTSFKQFLVGRGGRVLLRVAVLWLVYDIACGVFVLGRVTLLCLFL